MRSNGFWSPLRWDSCWGRVLCLCLCFVLLMLPSLSYGQTPSEHLSNIERSLTAILVYSQKLEEELQSSQRISEEQKQSIERLLSELGQLRTRLEVSRSLLEKYKSRAAELLGTIEGLEARLKQLSESYEASEISWSKALDAAQKEIRRQKTKTVIYVILAAAGAGYAGYRIGQMAQ